MKFEVPLPALPLPFRLVEKLFLTSVKLEAPKSGPAAEQHQQQLARDALDIMAEKNLAILESIGMQGS